MQNPADHSVLYDFIPNRKRSCTWSHPTVFPSDGMREFSLAMSGAVSVSAARTFLWASLHLVRRCGVWRTISHLVVAVKVARLALWLIFMGLDQSYSQICGRVHKGLMASINFICIKASSAFLRHIWSLDMELLACRWFTDWPIKVIVCVSDKRLHC